MFKYSKSKNVDFAKIYHKARKVYANLPPVKKRRRRNLFFKLIRYAGFAVIFVFLTVFLFIIINFLDIKYAYQEAISGKDNAEYSLNLFKEKQYSEAANFARLAENNFNEAGRRIERLKEKFIVKNFYIAGRQLNDLHKLILAGEVLCKAMASGSQFGENFSTLTGADAAGFAELDQEQKRLVLRKLYESGPELNGIKANIDLALINLEGINYFGLSNILKNKIELLKSGLYHARDFLAQSVPASELFPALLGYPEKSSYLVMLQNSDELRPSGGFLGTYGILEFENGEILRFDTHDIYHMDMPVKDLLDIDPPEPLVKYLGVDKWYMRDANWWPDWPESAKKIEWFFHQENRLLTGKNRINNFSGDFDGVIGITPEFVTDLLALTGPIAIEDKEFNQSNFTRLLEYRVEQEYVQLGIPSWHRKEVIGEISKIIQDRVLSFESEKLYSMFNLIWDNLRRKNLLFYFKDEQLQNIALDQNWAGEIKSCAGDYLMLADANMASYKTDAVIERKIEYRLTRDAEGVYARARINYSHSGSFDWRTTRYRTYLRAYAPLGSELIQVKGVSGKTNQWDESSVKSGQESGKTVFSAFIEIEPGEIGSLEFFYRLPESIEQQIENGEYRLYVQKQPGTDINALDIELAFSQALKNYGPTGFNVEAGDSGIKWNAGLKYDQEFWVEF